MKRHYYISDDLDNLATIEQELEAKGISTPQIHVLSENDAEVEKRHLHAIEAVLKQDVVHSTELGAIVGAVLASILLFVAYYLAYICCWMDSNWLFGSDNFRVLHLGRRTNWHSNTELSIQAFSVTFKTR
jgi:hypothetical protein